MGTYHCGQGYLLFDGERIGATTEQEFEFVPDPDSDRVHCVRYTPFEAHGVTFTMTFDYEEPIGGLDALMESMWPELGWQSFERDLDRRLRWLW